MLVCCPETPEPAYAVTDQLHIPVSTSTQPAVILPHQNYTPFESLFPLNYYPALLSMPTSLLINTLFRTVWWTTTMLRVHVPAPRPHAPGPNRLTRTLYTQDHPHMTSSLDELLAAMMPRYTELLYCGSFNY